MTRMTHPERLVHLEHVLAGRLRLRSAAFRIDEVAARAREGLASLEGVREVEHNPRTGSLLVRFEPTRVAAEAILARAAGAHASLVPVLPGQRVELPPERTKVATLGSHLARSFARFWEELDDDLYRASRGVVDLSSLLPFAFLAAGVANVFLTRKVPAPPWFNLFWWSFRSFVVLNQEAIHHAYEEQGPEELPEM